MSIDYYNLNAEKFINDTFHLSMDTLIDEFIKDVPIKGRILDLGCGSGRDSLFFKEKGFEIYAMDGSEEMVKHVKKYLGENVMLATFESYTSDINFDGIWALASLLHVPKKDIQWVLEKYIAMLNIGGVFFMSFKNREEDYIKDGREFTCFNEESLKNILTQIDDIEIQKFIHTIDVREGRDDEKWLSAIIKRKG